ncbi:MAG: SseB family protein [Marmoricola sp.]
MRSIPDPGFPGDDGSAPPALMTALAAYDEAPEAEESTRYREALAVLQDARVLVPVVAVLGEVEHDDKGLAHDKSSDLASVLMTGRDGRTALLAFTGNPSLTGWNPEARPVPVPARQAAQAALQDGATALLVDVAGPVLFVVEGEDLTALAAGRLLVRLDDGHWGWAGAR